jgi:hypothetical protein
MIWVEKKVLEIMIKDLANNNKDRDRDNSSSNNFKARVLTTFLICFSEAKKVANKKVASILAAVANSKASNKRGNLMKSLQRKFRVYSKILT